MCITNLDFWSALLAGIGIGVIIAVTLNAVIVSYLNE